MSKPVGIVLTGENKDFKLVKLFIEKLLARGEGRIEILQEFGKESLQVDISQLTWEDDLDYEILGIINTATGVKRYEKKRNKAVKGAYRKMLLRRKDIN